jgi:hypothetical protein
LKLGLTNIEKSIALNKRAILNPGGLTSVPFIYKSKVPKCNASYSTIYKV